MNDRILERNEVRASFYLCIFFPFSSIASIILRPPSLHQSTHSSFISFVFSSFVNLYLFPSISHQSIAPGVLARDGLHHVVVGVPHTRGVHDVECYTMDIRLVADVG